MKKSLVAVMVCASAMVGANAGVASAALGPPSAPSALTPVPEDAAVELAESASPGHYVRPGQFLGATAWENTGPASGDQPIPRKLVLTAPKDMLFALDQDVAAFRLSGGEWGALKPFANCATTDRRTRLVCDGPGGGLGKDEVLAVFPVLRFQGNNVHWKTVSGGSARLDEKGTEGAPGVIAVKLNDETAGQAKGSIAKLGNAVEELIERVADANGAANRPALTELHKRLREVNTAITTASPAGDTLTLAVKELRELATQFESASGWFDARGAVTDATAAGLSAPMKALATELSNVKVGGDAPAMARALWPAIRDVTRPLAKLTDIRDDTPDKVLTPGGDINGYALWRTPYVDYPEARITGKLVLKDPDGVALAGCSASVVNSRSRSLIVTAAHCLYSKELAGTDDGFFQNIEFIPAYRDGEAPYGRWKVLKTWIDPQFKGHGGPHDIGLGSVEEHPAGRLQDVVGGFDRGTLTPGVTTRGTMMGYPGTREYGAEELRYCDADLTLGPAQADSVDKANCATRSGNSGGPIITRTTDPHTGVTTTRVVAVVSSGQRHDGRPGVADRDAPLADSTFGAILAEADRYADDHPYTGPAFGQQVKDLRAELDGLHDSATDQAARVKTAQTKIDDARKALGTKTFPTTHDAARTAVDDVVANLDKKKHGALLAAARLRLATITGQTSDLPQDYRELVRTAGAAAKTKIDDAGKATGTSRFPTAYGMAVDVVTRAESALQEQRQRAKETRESGEAFAGAAQNVLDGLNEAIDVIRPEHKQRATKAAATAKTKIDDVTKKTVGTVEGLEKQAAADASLSEVQEVLHDAVTDVYWDARKTLSGMTEQQRKQYNSGPQAGSLESGAANALAKSGKAMQKPASDGAFVEELRQSFVSVGAFTNAVEAAIAP